MGVAGLGVLLRMFRKASQNCCWHSCHFLLQRAAMPPVGIHSWSTADSFNLHNIQKKKLTCSAPIKSLKSLLQKPSSLSVAGFNKGKIKAIFLKFLKFWLTVLFVFPLTGVSIVPLGYIFMLRRLTYLLMTMYGLFSNTLEVFLTFQLFIALFRFCLFLWVHGNPSASASASFMCSLVNNAVRVISVSSLCFRPGGIAGHVEQHCAQVWHHAQRTGSAEQAVLQSSGAWPGVNQRARPHWYIQPRHFIPVPQQWHRLTSTFFALGHAFLMSSLSLRMKYTVCTM